MHPHPQSTSWHPIFVTSCSVKGSLAHLFELGNIAWHLTCLVYAPQFLRKSHHPAEDALWKHLLASCFQSHIVEIGKLDCDCRRSNNTAGRNDSMPRHPYLHLLSCNRFENDLQGLYIIGDRSIRHERVNLMLGVPVLVYQRHGLLET